MRIEPSSVERLFSAFRTHRRIFVVLDRYNGDPLTSQGGAGELSYLALRDEALAEQPERSPALACLEWDQPGHLGVLEATLDLATREQQQPPWRPSICAWATAPREASAELLTRCLGRSLRCTLQPGSTNYLRYFDPRVFPRLAQILGSTDFAQPLLEWHQLDRDGSLVCLPIAGDPAQDGTTALRLWADDIRAAVVRIELMSRTAAAAACRGRVVAHTDNAQVDAALRDAASRGLLTDDDAVAFATRAIVDGTNFTRHPDLDAWCSRAHGSGIPLDDIVGSAQSSPTPTV
jgi:Domain of unknown function (DUF4123)